MDEEVKPAPIKKARFEVKMRMNRDGSVDKAIFIDDKHLDWEVDKDSYIKACQMGPEFQAAADRDIERHFVESVSDFLGRKVTLIEILKATQTGWI
jgi:hypothetical protein